MLDGGRVLAETRTVVEPAYRAALDRLPGRMRHIAGYHAGWWDERGRSTGNGGKALRPALVLAAAAAVGGRRAAAVPEAVAVKLVHDFSLLHGDTIRVSLSAPPAEQVKAGCHILSCLSLRPRKLEIVSCPGCGSWRKPSASPPSAPRR